MPLIHPSIPKAKLALGHVTSCPLTAKRASRGPGRLAGVSVSVLWSEDQGVDGQPALISPRASLASS